MYPNPEQVGNDVYDSITESKVADSRPYTSLSVSETHRGQMTRPLAVILKARLSREK